MPIRNGITDELNQSQGGIYIFDVAKPEALISLAHPCSVVGELPYHITDHPGNVHPTLALV